eukprot:6200934-Pleurochrysis_carterae.AAC.5
MHTCKSIRRTRRWACPQACEQKHSHGHMRADKPVWACAGTSLSTLANMRTCLHCREHSKSREHTPVHAKSHGLADSCMHLRVDELGHYPTHAPTHNCYLQRRAATTHAHKHTLACVDARKVRV